MKKLNLTRQIILALSLSIIFLSSCKEDDVIIDDPQIALPDGEALRDAFSENLEKSTQEFVMNASEGGSVTGEQGTVVWFSANSLVNASGDSIKGDVDVRLIEIYDKASMLFNNKPTMGRNGDGEIEMIISGGEFYVNATQNGEQVYFREDYGFTLMVPADATDEDMRLFKNENDDCLEADCEVIWEEEKGDNNRLEMGGNPAGQGEAYYGFVGQFGWTNIDKWYNDPRPKTTLFVDVPEGYDETNCSVYLSYDGEPTALATFDVYLEDEELFTEHYGQIPIGLEVHFIVVSIVDGEWNYAIQGATITEDHIEIIGGLSPTTEAELTDLINNLP